MSIVLSPNGLTMHKVRASNITKTSCGLTITGGYKHLTNADWLITPIRQCTNCAMSSR